MQSCNRVTHKCNLKFAYYVFCDAASASAYVIQMEWMNEDELNMKNQIKKMQAKDLVNFFSHRIEEGKGKK